VLVSVSCIILMFRKEKVVQRLKEIFADYEERMRKMNMVHRYRPHNNDRL
jgi:hypothetical protein